MTLLTEKADDTATNSCAPAGPPQVTDCHRAWFGAEAREVHVMPSGLLIARLEGGDAKLAVYANATNSCAPGGPPQAIDLKPSQNGAVWGNHTAGASAEGDGALLAEAVAEFVAASTAGASAEGDGALLAEAVAVLDGALLAEAVAEAVTGTPVVLLRGVKGKQISA